MELSIVIVNYRNSEVTKNCVASIVQFAKDISYEIIVVDNSPENETEGVLKEVFSDLVYIENENLGFGHANNKGMNVAKGKFLLLLNSDTELIDNSLAKCVGQLKEINRQTNNYAMLGCQLLNVDHSFQHSFFPFLRDTVFLLLKTTNPVFYRIFNIGLHYRCEQQTKEVGDISGAFMLLNREIYEETGGFDTDFFLFYEESDWCRNRIRRHYKIFYYPHAKVIHIGASSTPTTKAQVQKLISQGLFWYKKGKVKYVGFLVVQMINLLTFFAMSLLNKKYVKDRSNVIQASRYWFYDVFKYSKEINSNNHPLIYRSFFR